MKTALFTLVLLLSTTLVLAPLDPDLNMFVIAFALLIFLPTTLIMLALIVIRWWRGPLGSRSKFTLYSCLILAACCVLNLIVASSLQSLTEARGLEILELVSEYRKSTDVQIFSLNDVFKSQRNGKAITAPYWNPGYQFRYSSEDKKLMFSTGWASGCWLSEGEFEWICRDL